MDYTDDDLQKLVGKWVRVESAIIHGSGDPQTAWGLTGELTIEMDADPETDGPVVYGVGDHAAGVSFTADNVVSLKVEHGRPEGAEPYIEVGA